MHKGKLLVAAYAGNSAPDDVDQLHALPEYLAWVEWDGAGAGKDGGGA